MYISVYELELISKCNLLHAEIEELPNKLKISNFVDQIFFINDLHDKLSAILGDVSNAQANASDKEVKEILNNYFVEFDAEKNRLDNIINNLRIQTGNTSTTTELKN